MAENGFRRFLGLPTQPRLTELAELEDPKSGGTPVRPFAHLDRAARDGTHDTHEPQSKQPDFHPEIEKKEPARVTRVTPTPARQKQRSPSYTWRSQASKDKGSEAVRAAHMDF